MASLPEVTWKDQQNIISFAQLNKKKTLLVERTEAYTQRIRTLQDAEEEMILLDDDDLTPIQVGDTFVYMPKSVAESRITQMQEKSHETLEISEKELEEVKSSMAVLHAALKNKFGDAIGLGD